MALALSIIIPTWNTAQTTLKCIDTIKKNLLDISYEVIIVDNGSSDDTAQKIKKIINLFENKNRKLKIISNDSNLGFAKANNQGSTIAQGEYLFFLNSDMELVDSSLLDMLNFIKKNQNIGIIGPQFLNPDSTSQASVFPPQTSLNAFKEFWLNKKNSYSKYLPDLKNPSSVSYISGGALLISKIFFQQIGGWNEKYFFYFEDMDLCRQVKKHQKLIYYFPKCQVVHHHGLSGQHLADPKNQWRRLIPSSIKFHGLFKHYFINFIIWSGQKWQKLFRI